MIAISTTRKNASHLQRLDERAILSEPVLNRFRSLQFSFPLLLVALLLLAGCATGSGPERGEELTAAPASISDSQRARAEELVSLAEKALAQKRLKDAEILLERALSNDPGNPEIILNYGELHLARAEHQKAAATFTALINDAPVSARALQGRGIAALLLGDELIGRESLEQAVATDPTLWRAWNALGFLEDSEQNWALAEAHYAKALAQNPESAIAHNNRGFSRMMQRRIAEAIRDLNRALQLDQDFTIAKENLRLAYAWDGRYHLALSGVEDRNLPRVLNNIGYIAILRRDFSIAEAYLVRAMELSPRYHEQAAKNLAFLAEQRQGGVAPSEAQLP